MVRALELRKGSVDIALSVLTPDMVEALRDIKDLDVLQAPGTNYQYVAFNLKDPQFSDVRVRKAIAYAIDREKIIKHLWRGQAKPATGVIPPSNWSYAGDVEESLDLSLGYDDTGLIAPGFALNPKVVWHDRVSGNGLQQVGSAVEP